MKVVFACSDRIFAKEALQILKSVGVSLEGCLMTRAEENGCVMDYCLSQEIKVYTPDQVEKLLKEHPAGSIDLLISFSYGRIISRELIAAAKTAVNFHPGPLPEYRGLAVCCHGVYHQEKTWGVTLHHLAEGLDTGDIIEVRRFDIEEPDQITGVELRNKAWRTCLDLLKDFVTGLMQGGQFAAVPQGEGTYYSQKDLDQLKQVDLNLESAESILCKIRALWYPPYDGAYIEHDGKRFYLIDKGILKKCEASILW